MCGIFGVLVTEGGSERKHIQALTRELFLLSESRGKEAAGIVLQNENATYVMKQPVAASRMVRTDEYKTIWKQGLKEAGDNDFVLAMGHSRLVTNGHQQRYDNNQPVIKDDFVCIHNGIIVNDKGIWQCNADISREYDVDTEIIPTLVGKYLRETGSLSNALKKVFSDIEGVASTAITSLSRNILILASNNGSLYFALSGDKTCLIFASEKYILNQLFEKKKEIEAGAFEMRRVDPGNSFVFGFDKLDPQHIPLNEAGEKKINFKERTEPRRVSHYGRHTDAGLKNLDLIPAGFSISGNQAHSNLLHIEYEKISRLGRCSKCLLPETFPFIEYDSAGVCNYCHAYHPLEYKGEDALMELADRYRSENGQPDCIVPFSGGRDSSYSIHYIKEVLKLNPIAYTYDWGMVTDIARRNVSRMCAQLGIEHILISADIPKKRKNIKLNLQAWLKRPAMGTIPLFMAGDKQFFYYANMLKKQMNIDLLMFGMNPLERTDFKVAFCGINELKDKRADKHYNMSVGKKLRMAMYYGKEYLLNPAYINSSLADTLFGFFSYYFIPQDYYTFYEYLKWDEDTINNVLIDTYKWEVDPTTRTTWRIGDGTAAFYNYIYFRVAGFTENDTFRSNQIREGQITREEALKKIEVENKPRFESILWYLNTVGLDFNSTINRINEMPTRYASVK
jgi:glutamine---fructose-6-phosphate transaminase (isomerizing)